MTSRRELLQLGTLAALAAARPVAAHAPAHDASCVFCGIDAGKVPAATVYRDAHCLAFAALNPIEPGHLLVVPRRHVRDIYALDPELARELFVACTHIAGTMKRVLAPDGITLRQNNEAAGDQSVFHLHVHVIPRVAGRELPCGEFVLPEASLEARERAVAPLREALRRS